MKQQAEHDLRLWRRLVAALYGELAALPAAERAWLVDRLAEVARLQEQLHAFFLQADGLRLCRDCRGDCCDRGKHHLTLVNLLGCLLDGAVPEADFRRPCPFLGAGGCLLPPPRRPFNCVTFICDGVEEGLGSTGREAFYALERQLRALYLVFDRRYAGSSLRGILIRGARLGGRPLLATPPGDGVV